MRSIKTTILYLCLTAIFFTGQILAQDTEESSSSYSNDFENALTGLIAASKDCYKGIKTNEKIEISGWDYNKVDYDFPGAIQIGYQYDEEWDLYGEYQYHTIRIEFGEDENLKASEDKFNLIKSKIKSCIANKVGGLWFEDLSDKPFTEKSGRVIKYKASPDAIGMPEVELTYFYRGFGGAVIYMILDLELEFED